MTIQHSLSTTTIATRPQNGVPLHGGIDIHPYEGLEAIQVG
jgi:hypothetical protein